MVTQLTDRNFEEEVLKAEVPVMVDFFAPWCGPCRMVGPIVEKLSGEYDGRFKFGKLNVDENPEMARKYGVMSIPFMVFFKDGEKVDEVLGAVPEGTLRPRVDALLQPGQES
jgi:thioredoxin 1